MAGHIYTGTDRIKKIWLDAPQIKKIWVGTQQVFASSIEFTINNTKYELNDGTTEVSGLFKAVVADGVTKIWIYKVGDSTIKFGNISGLSKKACLVAGGGLAGAGYANGYFGDTWSVSMGRSGVGGNGGQVLNITPDIVEGTSYNITVGNGNQDTVAFGSTSRAGQGAKGATVRVDNADWGNWIYSGSDWTVTRHKGVAEDGSYAFNDPLFDGIKYGPGGGAGAVSAIPYQPKGGIYAETTEILGGETGGTKGNTINGVVSTPIPNRGSGAASGDAHGPENGDGTVRAGSVPGSGIIMLRFTE